VFERLEDSRCQAYPEAALDARLVTETQDIEPVEGDTAAPIVGFADLHTHIAFPKTMASVAMSGDIFHPLGIKQALGNCSLIHGKQGSNDFLEGQNTGSTDGHETSGYPEFSYWPNRQTNTHVQAYYRWIERAHLSGLKLIVSHVTGNPTFCQLLKAVHSSRAHGACTGLDAVEQQSEYLYQLQDYVDAQAGGPGKGWFRIVLTPQQAREVIAQGQMAVVLGVEHGELFDCRSSNEACTPDYIETQLDHLHELGIRSVFPLHRFDNAFGGTKPGGGDSGAWMHFSSRISTSSINHIIADILNPFAFRNGIDGEFYDLQDCPEPARGTDNIRDMDAFMHEGFSSVKDAVPFGLGRYLDPLLIDKLEPIPRYEAFTLENKPACNARGLQTLGVDLLNGLIDRAMIVEVDHLSYQTFSDVLDVLEQRGYPGFISSHSWFENQAEVRDRIHRLGGMISPMKSTPSSSAHAITTLSAERERFGLPSGVAISTDIQGVTSQAAADEGFVLQYPMRSYDGKVEFLAPKTGLRSFDYSVEGVAHYGLLPEWVDNLRQVDEHDNKVMSAFMASAEAYIQLWESAAAY
jgi:microsomal dipeptidase-like Zn-dependent dipeptidase